MIAEPVLKAKGRVVPRVVTPGQLPFTVPFTTVLGPWIVLKTFPFAFILTDKPFVMASRAPPARLVLVLAFKFSEK